MKHVLIPVGILQIIHAVAVLMRAVMTNSLNMYSVFASLPLLAVGLVSFQVYKKGTGHGLLYTCNGLLLLMMLVPTVSVAVQGDSLSGLWMLIPFTVVPVLGILGGIWRPKAEST